MGVVIEEVKDERAETATRPFFDGDECFVILRQLCDQLFIQRFGEAGIGDGDGQAFFREQVGGL